MRAGLVWALHKRIRIYEGRRQFGTSLLATAQFRGENDSALTVEQMLPGFAELNDIGPDDPDVLADMRLLVKLELRGQKELSQQLAIYGPNFQEKL